MPEGGEANLIIDALDAQFCPTCGVSVGSRRFFCSDCWRDVPYLLKGALREAAQANTWRPWLEAAVQAVRVVAAERAEA